jgi:hypothetical protein
MPADLEKGLSFEYQGTFEQDLGCWMKWACSKMSLCVPLTSVRCNPMRDYNYITNKP